MRAKLLKHKNLIIDFAVLFVFYFLGWIYLTRNAHFVMITFLLLSVLFYLLMTLKRLHPFLRILFILFFIMINVPLVFLFIASSLRLFI